MNCRRVTVLLIGLLTSSLMPAPLWAAATASTVAEEDVKLALVYKIARFVSWPDSGSGSFLLCVTGDSTFDAANNKLAGRQIRERQIAIAKVTSASKQQPACDALYISRDSRGTSRNLLEQFDGKPVLTLSDSEDFATTGGMVGLTIRNKRVGIQINVENYERVGLSVNSQLLQLAELVGERRASR
ncbi:MAG: YfiR family protein [Pseudomonadota bacterium]